MYQKFLNQKNYQLHRESTLYQQWPLLLFQTLSISGFYFNYTKKDSYEKDTL